MRLILLVALALALHVFLGWEWTIVAGVATGIWFGRRGWLMGLLVVGLDWLILVGYNVLVDARAFGVMTRTMGGLLGNLPSAAIVALTVLIGGLIGAAGGATGSQLRVLVNRHRQPVPQA